MPKHDATEAELCDKVASGELFDAAGEDGDKRTISAEVIRRLVLKVPLDGKREASPVTPAGIEIHNATIDGRVTLDNATAPDGGAGIAIGFRACHFVGGFSAASGHFSRLSFPDCSFSGSGADARGRLLPTVDLTDLLLDSGLSLRGVKPEGDDDYLWIRAPGARIGGHLDLSCAHLRAPGDTPDRLLSEPPIDALNLACADVRNDFYFLSGSRSEGRISARNARIRGDVWMSGAVVENAGGNALFFQGATVDGLMMMDERPDRADETGEVRPFTCNGGLNMVAAELGRDLVLGKAIVRGDARFTDLSVRNDLIFGAHVRGGVKLVSCRIGGTLDLSDLALGASSVGLDLTDGSIGRSLKLIRSQDNKPPARELIQARHGALKSLPGVELVETLWDYEVSPDRRETVQVGFLIKGDSIYRLDGRVGVLDDAVERFGHAIDDDEAAKEYLRIHCTYGLHERGACPVMLGEDEKQRPPFLAGMTSGMDAGLFQMDVKASAKGFEVTACVIDDDQYLYRRSFRIMVNEVAVEVRPRKGKKRGHALTGLPRFEGPLIRHPKMDTDEAKAAAEDRWVTAQTVDDMAVYGEEERTRLRGKLFEYLLSNVSLRGEVRLTNLSCAMLDDNAGRYWGSQVRIEMDHFVYHRATWETDEAGRSRSAGIFAYYWRVLKRLTAEWFWVRATRWLGWTDALRLGDHWSTWQIKRNWIYRQFDTSSLPSPARYRIRQAEYRPQPFEQAIRVARAEGREDFATEFEMLKLRIEWGLFNRRARWPLAMLAIVATYFWLRHAGGPSIVTDFALIVFIMTMLFISPIHAWIANRLPTAVAWTSPLFLAPVFIVPGLAVYFGAGWAANPLHFVVALIIFGALRLISCFAHGVMRFMFGYLRRPLRAIATLVGAFLIGWAGVDAANDRNLLVIDTAPVASLVEEGYLVGSPTGGPVVRNVPCRETISEPLYALDVLIPLIDLREESSCKVGRAVTADKVPQGPLPDSGLTGLIRAIPALTVDSEGFWAVMKALYAIAGWFIVSLSILTFANTNRTRAEPS